LGEQSDERRVAALFGNVGNMSRGNLRGTSPGAGMGAEQGGTGGQGGAGVSGSVKMTP
jgi:Predicted membrane protein